ncbi:MAG: hypothetical protein WC326_00685 [Candidatus Delongbacteria bacterium]
MADLTCLRVAAWPGGAAAPLNLMIDDLADVFVPARGCRGRECDWGHLGRGADSAWRFVEERLLAPFPELRISLFIPVNRRPLVEPPAGSRFHAIDERPEMREFLRTLAAHPRLECCYHGKDHFRGQGAARDQEFRSYATLQAALDETRRGLEIWDRVFQSPPLGGKYPGYAGGELADAAVAACGFRWWCRRFNRRAIQSTDTPAAELAPTWFAAGAVLEMPSTLAGNVLPPYLREEWPKWPKRFGQRRAMRRVVERQLEQLLREGLPLTVQEHVAPSREDGRRQRNNLQDDASALTQLLDHLRDKPVWHAHLTEIADHWRLREQTRFHAEAGALRVEAPRVDQLAWLELEALSARLTGLRGLDGQAHPVRQTPFGRFVALPLPLSCDVFQLEENPA